MPLNQVRLMTLSTGGLDSEIGDAVQIAAERELVQNCTARSRVHKSVHALTVTYSRCGVRVVFIAVS